MGNVQLSYKTEGRQASLLNETPRARVNPRKRVDPRAVELATELFKAVNTPLSLGMMIMLQSDHRSLVDVSVDPRGYADASKFALDYLAAECFSKFPSWDTGINREEAAITRFHESEATCRLANERLKGPYPASVSRLGVGAVMFTAREKIRSLLGEFAWADAEPFFDFGPGATYLVPRRRRHSFYKFSGIPECTQSCAAAAELLIRSIPGWEFHLRVLLDSQTRSDSLVKIVPGNRIVTVPKNAKTDRVIAIEPLINGMLQKGIGGVIRNRLRREGIDLNDQTPNQQLAREGSITGEFATIDLKAASDSVCEEVVRQLLPPSWVSAMELCRSSTGVLPSGQGKIQYQKWSSMGNGYTFELESLIFWAICSSAVDLLAKGRPFVVYGDDLVVPVTASALIIKVLDYCGFTCNSKKTFSDGPFRESCGKHYFHGTDVTPFYVRKDISIETLTVLANNTIRYAFNGVYGVEKRWQVFYGTAVSMLPPKLQRPRIPDGYGDAALIGDFDECCPRRARNGLEGWAVKIKLPVPQMLQVDGWPLLLSRLLASGKLTGPRVMSDTMTPQVLRALGVPITDVLLGLRLERGKRISGSIPISDCLQNSNVLVPQWVDYGPWI